MDQLEEQILQFFDLDIPPKFPELGTNWKHSEAFEETSFFMGKAWDDLSADDFEKFTCCHSFFPKQCALYYLGANMFLECSSAVYWTMAMDKLSMDLSLLHLPKKKIRGFQPRLLWLWQNMSNAQKSTFMAYLDRINELGESGAKQIASDIKSQMVRFH